MANGKVYVFNVYGETIDFFSPNSMSAGSIPSWAPLTDKAPFTPAQLAVGRVLNRSEAPGHFVNGSNLVGLSTPSGFATFPITIDGAEFPITENLVLYVSRNVWTLYNAIGTQKATGQVTTGLAFGIEADQLK